jgi:antitoxin ParD1/3/4
MTITLRPEHQQLIAEAMRTGAYRNPDDVINRALQMLHTEDEWLQDHKDSIEAKIDRAFSQFEDGHFLSPEESHADMERRKNAWLAEQQHG